ncbi:recombinase family protein [Streptomyces sp. 11x1]|uniref:recombinase family protein n=1 Tax=Streptomyces sp. 11x1 TaxID=3038642 RepID=UPI00292F33B5|nr:recombinase family protein [Streptomyces sp. 11x1]WNZ14263.1 recombinase family protein [Streptomyces sp. 11x1]
MAAAATLEPADVATLTKDRDIPIPTGLLVLPEPVVVENRGGSLSDIRAFGWQFVTQDQVLPDAQYPGIQLTCFMDRDGPIQPESWRLAISQARANGSPLPPLVPDGIYGLRADGELHLLKARLRGGSLSKARRGELIQPLPVGLVYDHADRVILDPDAQVQQAIRHLLTTFAATGSAYAVVKAFAGAGLKFPRRIRTGPNKGELTWGILQHHRVLQVLHNPRYAGAFFDGRRRERRGPGGKTTSHVLPREEWTVLITDAHPGYLTWSEFAANQTRLTELAAARGSDRKASPPREGAALLQGVVSVRTFRVRRHVVSCGKCGRRMTVRYRHQKPVYLTGVLANDKGEYVFHLPGPGFVRPVIGRPRRSVLDPEYSETTR